MEPITSLMLLAGAGYGLYRLGQDYWPRRWMPRPPSRPLSPGEQRQRQHLQDLNRKARRLQLALLRLAEAPDFRRAASWAGQAQDLPAQFRQRQFRRFRPRPVRHFAGRLAAGVESPVLLVSLRALLQALGIADFEADYIRADAERLLPGSSAASVPSFSITLQQLQREHQQRLDALANLNGLDPDLREQLLEAEKTRFRDTLQRLQEPPGGSNGLPL